MKGKSALPDGSSSIHVWQKAPSLPALFL